MNIPVIITSAFGHPRDFSGERFQKLVHDNRIPPPNCFMEKPIDRDIFIEKVEELLKQKQ